MTTLAFGPEGEHEFLPAGQGPSIVGERLAELLHPTPLTPVAIPVVAFVAPAGEDLVDVPVAPVDAAADVAPVPPIDAALVDEAAPVDEVVATGEKKAKKDKTIWGGIALVGVAAAILSWAGWVDLAHIAGIVTRYFDLAWLLPLCVDAYALVAARAWLSLPWVSEETRTFARKSTFLAVVISVLGNAAGHVLTGIQDAAKHTGGPGLPVWVLITVRVIAPALAPLMLALAAHLAALVARDWRDLHATDSDPVALVRVESAPAPVAAGSAPATHRRRDPSPRRAPRGSTRDAAGSTHGAPAGSTQPDGEATQDGARGSTHDAGGSQPGNPGAGGSVGEGGSGSRRSGRGSDRGDGRRGPDAAGTSAEDVERANARIAAAWTELTAELGRVPSGTELAARSQTSKSAANRWKGKNHRSLDAASDTSGGG